MHGHSITHLFLLTFVIAITLLAEASPAPPTPKPGGDVHVAATGHYEGEATNKENQALAVIIDLRDTDGALSGSITTPVGVFPITGGSRQGRSMIIEFDAGGQKGSITVQVSDKDLAGTFSLGDDGGPISVRKTSETPISSGSGKSALSTPIMFLGVYHMDNPGLDAVNLQADDVLAPKRQHEIEELVARLARFQPTKIAIEAPYRDAHWPALYQKYLDGQYVLGRNEIEQIGFRLAKRLRLPTLYGVDYFMFMNGLTLNEMEEDKAGTTAHNSAPATGAPGLSPEDELLRRSTVADYLLHLNEVPEIQKNHQQYMARLMPNADPAIYQNADLVSNWYKRNLRIFANINRISEPGKDRVLVIIGAGHLKLLKDFATDSPQFKNEDVAPLLKP